MLWVAESGGGDGGGLCGSGVSLVIDSVSLVGVWAVEVEVHLT